MDRIELVMTIVFENDETFQKLTKDECKLLLNASCSMSMKNKNVCKSLKKFQAYYEEKLLCEEICYELNKVVQELLSKCSECD